MLTICYCTNRKEPHFEWFFDSFKPQLTAASMNCRLVFASSHYDGPDQFVCKHYRPEFSEVINVRPKPSVWQGPHRLTQRDYFAAANARNTGLCLAPDGWIAYVDDLSVLMPGWLNCVVDAMRGNYAVCGSYKKVKDMRVENGVATYTEFPGGIDSRWEHGSDQPVACLGEWLFGCSFAAPVEWLLAVNGWDENCDSLGGEDWALGLRLQNSGLPLCYDRRMFTVEAEDLHAEGPAFIRLDKGTSPNDKSHALLYAAKASKTAPNYFGEGGIRALRSRILAGEPFPIVGIPEHDWYDGQPLRDM